MNSHETFDGASALQRVNPGHFLAAGPQTMCSLPASEFPEGTAGPNGMSRQSLQLLRDRYDRNSEAYLNGAICKIEYLDVVEQISQATARLIASHPADASGNGAGVPAASKRRVAVNTPCDADFAAVVQHACARLASRR